MNIKSNILFRIYLIGGLCTLFGVAVLGKVYQIQTYKHGYWKSLADSLTTNYFDVTAERGNIYSADDKLLEPAYHAPAGPIAPLDILYGHRPALAQAFFAIWLDERTREPALRARLLGLEEVTR